MASSDLVRFHVDLSHLATPLSDLRFHVGLFEAPLFAHDASSRAGAAAGNAAIALMPRPERITHYADVPEDALPDHENRRIKVTFDHGDSAHRLRGLALVATRIPPATLRRHRAEKASRATAPVRHGKLLELGVSSVEAGRMVEVLADADKITTPWDTAVTLVGSHPELGSVFPATAARVQEDHIDGAGNREAMANFANTIRTHKMQGKYGWATVDNVTDPSGCVMTYEYRIPSDPHEKVVVAAGTNMEQYDLSDETLYGPGGDGNGLQGSVLTPLQTSNDDPKMRNQGWSVTQGTPVAFGGGSNGSVAMTAGGTIGGAIWTVANNTSSSGISVDASSINMTGNTVSIDVTNNYIRTIGAYIEFYDEAGAAIDLDTQPTPPWSSNLPADLGGLETSTTKYLQVVQPETVILGIPVSQSSSTLTFPWPVDASGNPLATSFTLVFGSLGNSGYEYPQCLIGGVLTGVFSYGFPALFLVQGAVGGGKVLASVMNNPAAAFAVTAVVVSLLGGGTDAVGDVTQFLKLMAGIVVGLIGKAVLQAILTKIITFIGGMQVADAVPFVGWTLRVAAIAGYTAQLLETTTELASAPALLDFAVTATLPITVNVSPDPRHGLPGDPSTAVWPALAATYEVTLQYKEGTSTKKTGPMPAPESGTQLSVDFTSMPAFAQVQAIVTILASDGWMCGIWRSGWQEVIAPSGGDSLTLSGAITEQLAPLTADTSYDYNNSILASASGHAWTDDQPTATATSLGGSGGQSLNALTGLTILDATYDVGYAWLGEPLTPPLAGGTTPAPDPAYTVQNLSVLGTPNARLVTPNAVAAGSCYLAYQKYGHLPTAQAPGANFYLDTSTGIPNLRLFDLSGAPDVFDAYASPSAPSWGAFTDLASLDRLVVHQSGVAFGLSTQHHKLAILKLPKAGFSPDSAAPVAHLCSGLGTRQGLVHSPIAADVTPDGKVLVLEAGNRRVQAFDHAANPVASFDHDYLFSVDIGSIATSLDAGAVPEALQAAFQEKDPSFLLFEIDAAGLGKLDAGMVSPRTVRGFADAGTILGDQATIAAVHPTAHQSGWLIADPLCSNAYAIAHSAKKDMLNVYSAFNVTTVTTITPGQRWIVADKGMSASYDVIAGAKRVDVHAYTSWFPLSAPPSTPVNYIDLATDITGYIFVSYYTGDGSAVADYYLDIYTPEGKFLSRTASLVGARIALDMWRNLYTLDYRLAEGPGQQSEPTISQWVPSPPLAVIPTTALQAFIDNSESEVRTALAGTNVALPSSFTVTTVSKAGRWQIVGAESYDVILSAQSGGDSASLYIYPLLSSSGAAA